MAPYFSWKNRQHPVQVFDRQLKFDERKACRAVDAAVGTPAPFLLDPTVERAEVRADHIGLIELQVRADRCFRGSACLAAGRL